jgi:4a-hydroxytetrahydrobiopterin dehydratase
VTTLTATQVHHEALADWVLVVRALEARYETNGFATGLELVTRIGAAAEEADHHPDVTLTWPTVLVRLWSHDARGVTGRADALARRISAIAQELGVAATPARTQNLELCLDTAEIKATGPFWAAVLGYDWDEENLEIVDPDGRMPTAWFQQTDAPGESTREPRQRWHLDIHVDPSVADQRIEAALAAGGVLVSDEEAPSFTVLADAEGNRVCVCTWQSAATAIA